MWEIKALFILTAIAITSMLWTGFRGAPWVPTSFRTVRKMLEMAEIGPDDVVYDLGCGDGRVIVMAARRYKAQAVGFEIDPLRYLWCQMLIAVLGLRERVRIVYGDFFKQDLSGADVVTCYLLQDTNNKLVSKFEAELRPGTRILSNTFTFGELERVRKDGEATLYIFNPSNTNTI